MSEHIEKYIKDINIINEEIKAIKSADCFMDYDAKTDIINLKMKQIALIDMNYNMLATIGTIANIIEK